MCGSAGGEVGEEPVCGQSAGERQECSVYKSKAAKLIPFLSSFPPPLTLGLPVGFSLGLFLAFTDGFLVFDGDSLLSAIEGREVLVHINKEQALSLPHSHPFLPPFDMTLTLLIFSCPRVFPAKLSSVAGRSKQ